MRRFLLITGWLLSIPAFGFAATPSLTWKECVLQATRNNPDLLSSLQALAATQADYKGSYSGIFPSLTLSHTYTQGNSTGRTSTNWGAQGTASLDLINAGQWASIQSALASQKQSEASWRITASSTLLQLYRAFNGLLYAQEAIGVQKAIRDTWKMNSQLVSLRYQSGRESKGNQLNTQAQLLKADAALDQAGRDLRVSQQTLSQSLGQDSFLPLVVTGTWTAAPVPRPRPDFEAIIRQHPSVQLQEAAVEQARIGIKSARSDLWPTLGVSYTKGLTGTTEFPQNPFWAFSGQLNYPLFSGGPTATFYATAAAERRHEQARLDLRSTRSQVRTDLESAWSSFAQAQDQVGVQRAFLDAARQRKEESDVRYQNGLMSFEDWIRVVSDYADFQTTYLRSQQSLILAEAQWRFAQGEPI